MSVHELERLAARAMIEAGLDPCLSGHTMEFAGGANCGCEDGACSVPVYECALCGDSDYGENDEAKAKRRHCTDLKGAL
jgi:hypothetical protein